MSVNKVTLLGRLGNDPELRYTSNGEDVCNFSIATSESWHDKNGQLQERVEWHRIVVWRGQARSCAEYLFKGKQCYIEGRIQTRSWEDEEGNKHYTTEVVASKVLFIGSNSSSNEVEAA